MIALPNAAATERLGKRLAAALPTDRSGWMVLLKGELGAGKSTLARAMLRAFGHDEPVPSPTYTLVEPYALADGMVYHVDLFRIAQPDELEFLGWSDLRDGLTLIEWPERVAALTAQGDLMVELRYAGRGREAVLRALSQRGREVLEGVLL